MSFFSLDLSVVLFRVGCRAVVRLAKNTEADKPIFLREHLLQVHDVSVATLKDNGDKKLVSLVGCPGTGKTWCGWLVANTLQCKHKVQVLHLTIRGTDVIAIWASDGRYQKITYEKVDVSTSSMLSMLGQVLTDSKCNVCIIDVGDLLPDEVKKVFRGVHRIIERLQRHQVHGLGLWAWRGGHHWQSVQYPTESSDSSSLELVREGV